MTTELIVALLSSSLIGGLVVAVANHLFTKEKVKAEAKKLEAETQKIAVETKRVIEESEYERVERSLKYSSKAPKGWTITGDDPFSFKIGTDKAVVYQEGTSAFIESVRKTSSFAGLFQQSKADKFKGQRIRMSGFIRSENTTGWAGLWLRIDAPTKKAVAFDNMVDRPIKGTVDWSQYHIVLDVPEHAYKIAYGIVLEGEGKVWVDKLRFETVDYETPTTIQQRQEPPHLPEVPSNLDFEL